MTNLEIAEKLYDYCKSFKYEQAQRALYHEDAQSIEPPTSPNPITKGLENIIKKGDAFQAMIEKMHSSYVNKPKVYGNYIAMEMGMDITFKGQGRQEMHELCIYEIRDGKIVSEQFFY